MIESGSTSFTQLNSFLLNLVVSFQLGGSTHSQTLQTLLGMRIRASFAWADWDVVFLLVLEIEGEYRQNVSCEAVLFSVPPQGGLVFLLGHFIVRANREFLLYAHTVSCSEYVGAINKTREIAAICSSSLKSSMQFVFFFSTYPSLSLLVCCVMSSFLEL